MREARLIVPFFNKDGGVTDWETFEEKLVSIFGGFTSTLGFGGWKAPDGKVVNEAIHIYDIAVEGDRGQDLTSLALYAKKHARQDAVYLRMPSGEIHLI